MAKLFIFSIIVTIATGSFINGLAAFFLPLFIWSAIGHLTYRPSK